MGFLLFGTIARKKKTLNNLMDTILKVCKKERIPEPKLVTFSKEDSADFIVSSIMKRAEEICKKVCTFENLNHARKG